MSLLILWYLLPMAKKYVREIMKFSLKHLPYHQAKSRNRCGFAECTMHNTRRKTYCFEVLIRLLKNVRSVLYGQRHTDTTKKTRVFFVVFVLFPSYTEGTRHFMCFILCVFFVLCKKNRKTTILDF